MMDTPVDNISSDAAATSRAAATSQTVATSTTQAGFGYGPTSLSKSSKMKLAAISFGAIVIAIAGWTALDWTRSAREIAGITKYTVAPQTFSVVLKEKGELKAANSTNIASQVEGRSTIISLIPEGTQVNKGDLLVELASDQIDNRIQQDEIKEANAVMAYEASKTELEIQKDRNESDIRKALLEIELDKLELEKYEKGEWTQRHKDASIAIDQAKITLERRKQDYEAAKELIQRGFITQTEFQEDEFDHQKAIWDLEKAIKAKEVLERYTHVANLRRRQSDVEEAIKEFDRVKKNATAEEDKKTRSLETRTKELALIRDQLAKLRRQKKNCSIYAPAQGFVVYYSGGGGHHFMSSDNQIREGATVYERQIMLSLPDTSEMMVLVRVHEAKTDKLKIGQHVNITIEGIPGKQFTGTVTKIAVLADSQNRWLNPDLKEYETEITLDPSDVPLKPGVTAYAEIMVENIDNKLAIPVQTIYSKNARRYVFKQIGRDTEFAEIKLGAIGMEWAQVNDGLSPGDQILLAFGDEEKRKIPDLGVDKKNGKKHGRGMKGSSHSGGATHGSNPSLQGKSSSSSKQHGEQGQHNQYGSYKTKKKPSHP